MRSDRSTEERICYGAGKKPGGGCTDKLFWAFLLIFFRHGVCGKHGFFFVIIRNLITKY